MWNTSVEHQCGTPVWNTSVERCQNAEPRISCEASEAQRRSVCYSPRRCKKMIFLGISVSIIAEQLQHVRQSCNANRDRYTGHIYIPGGNITRRKLTQRNEKSIVVSFIIMFYIYPVCPLSPSGSCLQGALIIPTCIRPIRNSSKICI